jgi:hypothetical protein
MLFQATDGSLPPSSGFRRSLSFFWRKIYFAPGPAPDGFHHSEQLFHGGLNFPFIRAWVPFGGTRGIAVVDPIPVLPHAVPTLENWLPIPGRFALARDVGTQGRHRFTERKSIGGLSALGAGTEGLQT